MSTFETFCTLHNAGGDIFYNSWRRWSHFVYYVVPVKNICTINFSAGESLFTSLHNLRYLCNERHHWRYLYISCHPWRHFLHIMASLATFCAMNGTTGDICTFHIIPGDISYTLWQLWLHFVQ